MRSVHNRSILCELIALKIYNWTLAEEREVEKRKEGGGRGLKTQGSYDSLSHSSSHTFVACSSPEISGKLKDLQQNYVNIYAYISDKT